MLKVNKNTPGLSHKLEDKWKGPYYIRQKGPYDTYKIADYQTNKLHKPLVNAKHLKRYNDPLNYRFEYVTADETESDDDTENVTDKLAEQASEQAPEPLEVPDTQDNDARNTANTQNNQSKLQDNQSQIQSKPPTDIWYSANKIMKQRKIGQRKEYLVEWANRNSRPSWQDEDDVSDELKRQFYIKHTQTGKRRKRPYKYFN